MVGTFVSAMGGTFETAANILLKIPGNSWKELSDLEREGILRTFAEKMEVIRFTRNVWMVAKAIVGAKKSSTNSLILL